MRNPFLYPFANTVEKGVKWFWENFSHDEEEEEEIEEVEAEEVPEPDEEEEERHSLLAAK